MSAFLALLDTIGFWRGGGVADIRGIRPEGGPPSLCAVRDPANLDRVTGFFEQQGLNVYFGVNPRATRCGGKVEVLHAVTCHADIDNPDYDWTTHPITPSAVVFSGGGWHLYWTLGEPCEDLRRVERVNAKLAIMGGGDHCWDVSRVLRVPGTLNRPGEKKRTAGRTDTRTVLEACWDGLHGIDDLENATAGIEVELPPEPEDVSREEFECPSPETVKRLLRRMPTGDDRSRNDWQIAVDAYFNGGTDLEVAGLLWYSPIGSSAEKGLGYLYRTMAKAKAHAADLRSFQEALV